MDSSIVIVDTGSDESRARLRAALAQEKLDDACSIIAPEDDRAAQAALWIGPGAPRGFREGDRFTKPMRFGALLARIIRHKDLPQAAQKPERIRIGSYVLDLIGNILQGENEEVVRLTDKETKILAFLHEAGGRTVERRALLENVWGHAAALETHTLETHIYRLRQKIERDPARPEILLTDEAGYRLVV